MKPDDASSQLLDKLRSSRLYALYSEAFEVATGCRVELRRLPGRASIAVSFGVGEGMDFFLVLAESCPCDGNKVTGLLKSFALQLEDEVNRAVLEQGRAESKGVQRAKDYILKHLREGHHLDDVADAVGVCPFKLCRSFKASTGMTMTEYGSRLRVEMARKRLMDPYRSITEIAEASGFTSISQFNRNFLKYVGESPSRYRLKLGKLESCDLTAV